MTTPSELRRLAEAATAGPWEWTPEKDVWEDCGPNLRSVPLGTTWDEFWGPDGMGRGKDHNAAPDLPYVVNAWGHDAWGIQVSEANAAYIAAAHPAAVLALLDRIERLEKALRSLSNEVLGSLPLMEPLARREFGNTNYNILIQRAEEARAALGESP